jgi:uncharacterized BrkB/YihY/UPF0761 family membrane protein
MIFTLIIILWLLMGILGSARLLIRTRDEFGYLDIYDIIINILLIYFGLITLYMSLSRNNNRKIGVKK